MIFVTVGVQLPFDRLIRTVDDWAGRCGRRDVVAQVGSSSYIPKHIEARPRLPPDEFRNFVEKADVVIAHAGMGSIITALELGKAIIVLPRRAALGEHRNDHQLATARHMGSHGSISVAENEDALVSMLDRLDFAQAEGVRIASEAGQDLIAAIGDFIRRSPTRERAGLRRLRSASRGW